MFDALKSFFSPKPNSPTANNTNVARIDQTNAQLLQQLTSKVVKDFDLKYSERIATIYTCINILASTLAKLPIEFTKVVNGKKVPATDHYFFNALTYNPQTFYSRSEWVKNCVSNQMFGGNALAYIDTDTAQLEIIRPEQVNNIKLSGKNIVYELLDQNNSPSIILLHSQVLHFRGLSRNGIWGISPIQSLSTEIQLAFKSVESQSNFYSNNLFTNKYIQRQVDFNKTQQKTKEDMDDLARQAGSFLNSGTIPVIPNGYELKYMNLSAQDLSIIQMQDLTQQKICALYGVPSFMMSHNDSTTQKFEEANLHFITYTISNLISTYENELNSKLLSPAQRTAGYNICFNTKKLYNMNFIEHVNAIKILVNAAILSPEQAAGEFGFEYDDQGTGNGKLHYQQMQYVPSEWITKESVQNSIAKLPVDYTVGDEPPQSNNEQKQPETKQGK